MDLKQELKKLQEQFETKKAEKIRLEERKRQLEEEKSKIETQLKELNITSIDELKKEISSLENQITEGIEKCKQILK